MVLNGTCWCRIQNLVRRQVKEVKSLRHLSSNPIREEQSKVSHEGKQYLGDDWTNVTSKILSLTQRKLHMQKYHPLNLIKQRIVQYMYARYTGKASSPLFAVVDNLNPVVSIHQNFDSLLVPADHVSRRPSESYYFNKDWMLRAHTSAHQSELIQSGLDNFLVVGDVYRRDTIDGSHYPVFHQVEGVRLCDKFELFGDWATERNQKIFEDGERNERKQQFHTLAAVEMMERDLKSCLEGLVETLFSSDENLEHRWVETYFPFTHPSWELEIYFKGEWMEVLGCGIMEQQLLNNAGARDKLGWACGLGLERLAMKLYQIPDIRLFWSEDTGFLSQFRTEDPNSDITYKAVSVYPQCKNDISFWIQPSYDSKDFYDLVRTIGGNLVEQVDLIDSFQHPKTKRWSHCYRITYRHLEKTLTQAEVNDVHDRIARDATETLNVEIR